MRLPGLFVPLVTLGWVGLWVLWIGAPRPIRAARLWGGPTDGLSHWSGWVEASNEDTVLSGADLSILVEANGKALEKRIALDAEGRAEVSFDFGAGPPKTFHAAVRHSEVELASGTVALARERWLSRARRRGGYLPTKPRGTLHISVAPERGALAVPFPSALLVQVKRGDRPVAGAAVRFKSDGVRVTSGPEPTDQQGLTRVALTPSEHVVTVLLEARTESGETGELSTSVPIVPGALFAELDGARLGVTSPNERPRAFVTVVSERGRVLGATVALQGRPDGTAHGFLLLPELPKEPLWAVVSSELGEPSRARVGWPLSLGSNQPARTLDAEDVLLLDGFPKARADEVARRLRARRFALMGGILGALFSVGSVLTRAMKSQRELGRRLREQLDPEAFEQVAPRSRLRSALFMLLILLGFLIISLVLAWRLGSRV